MLWAPTYDLFHYINVLFYITYFYLAIGLAMFVIKGKFFDGMTYSFRRVGNRVSKMKDYLDEWEDKPLPSEYIEVSVLKMFLFQGSVLLVGMLALLYVFYQG